MEPGATATPTATSVLLYEKRGPVGYVTLNRPEKINAMNGDVYRLLEHAVEDYAADPDLRCLVITGAGGNFSSGGDLNWFREQRLKAKEQGKSFQYDFPAYRAMDRLKKPVIAAIDGYCMASGLNCALFFCDIRIATDRARFGSPATRRGLNDAGNRGIYPMPFTWYMGLGEAMYLLITGKTLDAQEALRIGMVNEIVPADQLLARAEELALQITELSPSVVSAQKMLQKRFQEFPGASYGRLRELLFSSFTDEEYFEGTGAFLEKRKPEWHD